MYVFKSFVRHILDRLGYVMVRKGGSGGFNLFTSEYLGAVAGPKTVVDVGVGYGTPALYTAYPDAYIVLVEPLVEYKAAIDGILNRYNGTCYYAAVGDSEGTAVLEVNKDDLHKTSHYRRSELTCCSNGAAIERRTVTTTTLDALLAPVSQWQRPLLLKIDTEGNELRVLRGATKLLEATDFLLVETSVAQRFENSYAFEELLAFTYKSGFRLFSILSIAYSVGEQRPRYADLLFTRAD
jgi:FkbM family methyltransferase